MNSMVALIIVLAVFTLRDIISYFTKSIVSMLFTASVVFIIAFWNGLPATVFADAQLSGIGGLMVGLLITHMGTMLDVGDFIKQWKTIIVAIFAMFGIGLMLFTVGPIFVDRIYAIAAAPPIAGGVVATLVMGERAEALGMSKVQIFVIIIVAVQGFIGYPICSFILNREAKSILSRDHFDEEVIVKEKKTLLPPLPKDLQTTYMLLLKLAISAFIAQKLSVLTNGLVHQFVICLFIGVLGRYIGFLEPSTMTQANAFGQAMTALMAVIFAPLANATPEILQNILFPLIITLILGTIEVFILSTIASKFSKCLRLWRLQLV